MSIAAAEPNSALVGIVVVAVVGAAAMILALWLRRRPPRPEPGPATTDFGSETPALVDLLTGGFVVDDDAVPATVLDLAARRWFAIEEVMGGNVIIRLRRASPGKGELTRYEQRVLRHIEAKAVDDIAPAAALTLGAEGVSRRWWKGFVREVNAHARESGLAVRRWDLRHLAMIWVPVGVAWLAVVLAGSTAEQVDDPGAWGSPSTVTLGVAILTLVGLTEVARRVVSSDAQSETTAGMAAASRWLGVRRWMVDTASFADKSAASVVIWERQLAYATAMGLAPVAQGQLPFEVDHDRHAWSRATGSWRRVRIRYLPAVPSWGERPWSVALSGAIGALVMGVFAWVGITLASDEFDTADLPEVWQERLPIVGLVVAVLAIAAVAWNGFRFLLGLSDLFARREVGGEVVRKREHRTGHRLPRVAQWLLWSGRDESGMRRSDRRRVHLHLAVDDGSDDSIVAYRVDRARYRAVREGARVELRVSPRLGYVAEAVETAPPPRGEASVAHDLAAEVVDRAGEAVGGLGERLTAAFAAAGAATEGHEEMLDTVDEDGVTLRQRLDQARAELQRLEGSTATTRADGAPVLGGLIAGAEQLLHSLGGAAGATDPPTAAQGPAEYGPGGQVGADAAAEPGGEHE